MKTLRMFRTSMMASLMCMLALNFIACSDDDDKNEGGSIVNPSNVFTGERPKSISGVSLTYDAKGLLTGITSDDGRKVTFEYHNVTKAVNQQNYVRMTVIDTEYNDTYIYEMELNEQGFVKYCEQTVPDSDGDTETWNFKYDAEGHLIYMKYTDGIDKDRITETTNITYKDGNIIETSTIADDEPGKFTHTISYTSDKVSKPIENKGCIMLFDETLGVDMDDMALIYYAGLLGKATKNLPVKSTDEENYTSEFIWTLNNNGYPTQVVIKENGYEDKITFEW